MVVEAKAFCGAKIIANDLAKFIKNYDKLDAKALIEY